MKTLKRWLFLFHRWLGVVLCLWFALLFATGIIMMYVEYPELTEEERVSQLEPLNFAALHVNVEQAAQLGGGSELRSIKLTQVTGRPAYQFTDSAGQLRTIFADDGSVLEGLTPEQALAAAQHSGFAGTDARPAYAGLLEMDQWTVSSALNNARPLHKVVLNDAAGTQLYISNRSGQVVRDTERTERLWNWLGSTVHWIYPWQLRRHATVWSNLLIYLSLAGVFSVLSGAVIGYWRLRVKNPYRGTSVTPYQGIQRWHHLLGLGFLIFVSTWIFSGLMSMSPWHIFDNATQVEEQELRYQGGLLTTPNDFPALTIAPNTNAETPEHAAVRESAGAIKEVEWRQLGATRYLVLSRSATDKSVLLPSGLADAAALQTLIAANVQHLQPNAALFELQVQNSYDSYYYTHHNRYRPLPVLRARFNDAENCWYYLDLNTGALVQRLTTTDRWARWLYNGMHSLDFSFLFQHRPVWDISVIVLCLCGFGFALTSVVLGWRRLRSTF